MVVVVVVRMIVWSGGLVLLRLWRRRKVPVCSVMMGWWLSLVSVGLRERPGVQHRPSRRVRVLLVVVEEVIVSVALLVALQFVVEALMMMMMMMMCLVDLKV